MTDYIVYTEIHEDGAVERWYYGRYSEERANEVAEDLGCDPLGGVWHCACPIGAAEKLGVLNCPKFR